MKDARADLVRESLEYSIVVLAGVGDAARPCSVAASSSGPTGLSTIR